MDKQNDTSARGVEMDIEIREALKFAGRVAQAMDKLRSSHVFFILQSAYPENEDWEWSDFQNLLTRTIVTAQRWSPTPPLFPRRKKRSE